MLPFDRFEGSDAVLGPEMRSTGEVMGVAPRLPDRVRQGAGGGRRRAAQRGTVFITVTDADKPGAVAVARCCTTSASGSSPRAAPPRRSQRMGVPAEVINKIGEGSPHVVDWIEGGEVDLVVNTPTGSGARTDGWEIRRAAVARGIPCLTTLGGGLAAARAIAAARQGEPPVLSLQELHARRRRRRRGGAR